MNKEVKNIDLSKVDTCVLEHILNQLDAFKDTFKYLNGTNAEALYNLLLAYENNVRNELELRPYKK